MDNKDLSALIRMADEVDRFEQPGGSRFEFAKARGGSGRDEVLRRWMTGLGGLAAAACLGLMAMVWLKTTPPALPPASPNSDVGHVTPVAAPTVVAQAEPEHSVLMAVFRDADDRCSCVQLNSHQWGKGRKLSDVGSGELLRTAMAGACNDHPQRVLVIAMAGPKGSLPSSTAEAEVLATCLAENAGHCGDDSICYTSNAMGYLPAGVTVLAESMGMDRQRPE